MVNVPTQEDFEVLLLSVDSLTKRVETLENEPPPVLPERPKPPTNVPITWSFASRVPGAGFQNVVAIDPANDQLVVGGGDLSGISFSSDGGKTWRASLNGMWQYSQASIASLWYDKTIVGRVYALTNGGVWRHDKSGDPTQGDWQRISTAPKFSGGNNASGGAHSTPSTHPRSIGNLIGGGGNLLYAGTLSGVFRTTDGTTWNSWKLSGKVIRSLVVDTTGNVYAGVWDTAGVAASGVYKFTAGGTQQWFRQIDEPEDITIDKNGRIWIAAGTSGVIALNSNNSGYIKSTLATGKVYTVTAFDNYIFAGMVDMPNENAIQRANITGAIDFIPLAQESDCDVVPYGLAHDFWLSVGNDSMMIYKGSGVVSNIAVTVNKLITAGRSGYWVSENPIASNPTFKVSVKGVGTIVGRQVTYNSKTNKNYVATVDWDVLESDDYFDDNIVKRSGGQLPIPGSPSKDGIYALATDPTTGRLWMAHGNRDKTGEIFVTWGALYYTDDASRGWTHLPSWQTAAGTDARIHDIVVLNDSSLVVTTQTDGLWTYRNNTWTQRGRDVYKQSVQVTLCNDPTGWNPFTYPKLQRGAVDGTVWLNDPNHGIWRSIDRGDTWELVRAGYFGQFSGYMAAPPSGDNNILYFADKTGQSSDANTMSRLNRARWIDNAWAIDTIEGQESVGQLIWLDSGLYHFQSATQQRPWATIQYSSDPSATTPAFVDITADMAGDSFGSYTLPFDSHTVGPNNEIILSSTHHALLVGTPL